MKLSVVIPAYNEVKTIEEIVRRVKNVPVEKEIIIVDDFSVDGTREKLKKLESPGIRVFFHEKNQGKGAALRTGFKHVCGDVVVIQDADLEYNPEDYIKLLKPIQEGAASVVYGSRFLNREYVPHSSKFFYLTHFLGNKFLNLLLNALYNTRISDMETCYKVFRKEVLEHISLSAKRFEIEPEITTSILNKGFKIQEIPILYYPRDYRQGKKISWKDGLAAAYVLIRNRFSGTPRSKGRGSLLEAKSHPRPKRQGDFAERIKKRENHE